MEDREPVLPVSLFLRTLFRASCRMHRNGDPAMCEAPEGVVLGWPASRSISRALDGSDLRLDGSPANSDLSRSKKVWGAPTWQGSQA